MKKLLIALTALAVTLGGCATKTTDITFEHPIYDTSLVSFEGLDAEFIKDVRRVFIDGNLLQAQVVLKSDSSMDVWYKIDWLDKNGMVLRNALDDHYKAVRLNRNREFVLTKVAQDKRAVSFKIYFTSKGTK